MKLGILAMNPTFKPSSPSGNQRGVVAMSVALMTTVLIGVAAIAIDVGHALLTRTQLQSVADGAALAAGRQLGLTYIGLPFIEQQDMGRAITGMEQAQILAMVTTTAYENPASDVQNMSIDTGNDVQLGTWDFTAKTFTPTVVRPNAISVTARRDGNVNGPISTFFAGVFQVNSMDVAATAVAALGTVGGPAAPGAMDAPFGISEDWFTGTAQCGDSITFSPTGTQGGCAGWHTFEESPANAKKLRDIVDDIAAGNFTSPPVYPGQTQFTFTGGTVASAFPNLINLFNTAKVWNPNTSQYEWQTKLPVYEANGCANPSGPVTIVGFANAVVTNVQAAPQKIINAQVQCDTYFDAAPDSTPLGGGGTPTPLSPYPRLVS